MKKILSLALGIIISFSYSTSIKAEKYNPFNDVPESHYAYNEISILYNDGIINGKSATVFAPEDKIKREEFAKVLALGLGVEKGENTGSFSDVVSGSWYEQYVEATKEAGLFKGVSENQFGVGTNVTKQDCALAVYRLSDIKKPINSEEGEYTPYSDMSDVSDYAKEAVEALLKRGVLKAKKNEAFNPQKEATRAEVCVMLQGVLAQADKKWDVEQWYNIDRTVVNDRLTEQMPPPFSVDNYPKMEIGTCEFNDGTYGDFEEGWCPGTWSIEENGGVDGSACLKVEQSADARSQLQLYIHDNNAKPGDWYVATCKVKTENPAMDATERLFMEVYDSNGKWLDASDSGKNAASVQSDEWFEKTCLLMVPEVANSLDGEEPFYTLRFGGYMRKDAAAGTVAYFDDFKLTKVIFDPMDTVLITPNYKGLIYGDGISDINLRAYMNTYNGYYNVDDFIFSSIIEDADGKVYAESKHENITDVIEVSFSSNILPTEGDYYLVSTLTSKESGEQLQKQEWTLRKRAEDYRPDFYIDEYNRIVIDGKPSFPLKAYYWASGDFTYEKALDALEGTDFLDVTSIGTTFYLQYQNPRVHALEKRMSDLNLQGILGMAGFAYSNMYSGIVPDVVEKQTDIRKLIELFCENYKDDPILFGYYNWDEQNPVRYGEELRWQNDIMSAADINHPTLGAADTLFEGRPGVYAKTIDIIGCDPYVDTGKDDMKLSEVTKRVETVKTICPNKPINTILQAFWFKERGDLRGPTEQEYRNMAWQAVCAGTTMLDSYALTDPYIRPWNEQTPEEIWEGQFLVFREIEYMEPVILSRLPAPYYEVKGGGEWLNHMSRRHEGKSYLFTINNENSARSCRVYLDGVKKIKGMYTGTEYTADASGWFKIDLDGYEVDIFEYEQEDYLSSHCELTRVGVSNGKRSYIVTDFDAENPVINIDDGAKTIDCNITASDYAKIYINGQETQNCTTVNIEGTDKINIKVVSEDGRFSSEKTYLLSRVNLEEKGE
ncbi:MAG: hypothetical protein E7392_00025 [Ruminococcaceae bacterium]|nr:hypothetical protein [Oscillospiraceae bacterium]